MIRRFLSSFLLTVVTLTTANIAYTVPEGNIPPHTTKKPFDTSCFKETQHNKPHSRDCKQESHDSDENTNTKNRTTKKLTATPPTINPFSYEPKEKDDNNKEVKYDEKKPAPQSLVSGLNCAKDQKDNKSRSTSACLAYLEATSSSKENKENNDTKPILSELKGLSSTPDKKKQEDILEHGSQSTKRDSSLLQQNIVKLTEPESFNALNRAFEAACSDIKQQCKAIEKEFGTPYNSPTAVIAMRQAAQEFSPGSPEKHGYVFSALDGAKNWEKNYYGSSVSSMVKKLYVGVNIHQLKYNFITMKQTIEPNLSHLEKNYSDNASIAHAVREIRKTIAEVETQAPGYLKYFEFLINILTSQKNHKKA